MTVRIEPLAEHVPAELLAQGKGFLDRRRTACAGDPLAYDFEGELAEARSRTSWRQKIRAAREDAEERLAWGALGLSAPEQEALHVHAQKFGPEGVNEVAGIYGVNMRVKQEPPKPKRRRRTTAELKAQVMDLVNRGMVRAAIADVLNISDARVAKIIREIEPEPST